ncbi:hypothetical protein SARC_01955 [Sphaeroforma arctica JP610]|uniref:Thioredoxin domain-containing protein n=1 Tax=Sphaeroforma arctica JP610 TaxID=667725 RepID=A0A0L0GAE7_9EUKA|nr:hypothetical protein SARC_01955 [Sphaeroforma arctica JP610]KNC85879.1 hypothetical protein SARC_01955 [Sphaeroforma arctica JP610]|eukprot:XP_014159781.1 hypothetical protein SARC_01955 [Sphaeroforma arctica JP610]
MVLITRSWCQASRALKDKLASSSEVQELAKQFTLLKLDETTDPLVPQWTDGTYTPRVVFVAPHGKGYPQAMPVDNLETGNKDYPHYYWDAEQVYAAMEKALAIHEEDYPNRPLVDVLEPANVRLPYDVPDVHHLVYTRPQEDEHAHDDPTKPHVEGNDGAHRRTQRSAGKKARSEL